MPTPVAVNVVPTLLSVPPIKVKSVVPVVNIVYSVQATILVEATIVPSDFIT